VAGVIPIYTVPTMTTTNKLKVIVLRSALLEGLQSVERSVGGDGSSLPILRNVLIRARAGGLELTTTNLELVVLHSVQCKVVSEGALTVPFSVLLSIVRNLTSERITLLSDKTVLEVVADSYEASVHGQAADEFPLVPSVKKELSLRFSVGALKGFFSQVFPATQYSDIRPEISGVSVQVRDGQVFFVATDSFRLSERVVGESAFTSTFTDDASFILPIKTVGDVMKTFANDDAQIDLFYDTNQVMFRTDAHVVISRLVDGTFPDYQQILPNGFSHTATLAREELTGAVKIASSLSGKGSDMTFRSGENGKFLEVFSFDSSLGKNTYRVPAVITGGGVFTTVLNWRYVLDGLKVCVGEEVVLGVNGADKPVGITTPSIPSLKYVVMPIKS
jgi:DNA polymerase III subunit beta